MNHTHPYPYALSQFAGQWRRDVLAQARQQRVARQLAALARATRRAERAERRSRQATRRARQLRARLEQ